MEELKENIRQLIEDVLYDLNISYKYNEEHSCFVTAPLSIRELLKNPGIDMMADEAILMIRIYKDAFSVSMFCARYELDNSNVMETLVFAGLLNNICLDGNSLRYFPERPINFFRYVDCVNTVSAPPSVSKIVKNLNLIIADYINYMDWTIAVDLGVISATDAFNMIVSE